MKKIVLLVLAAGALFAEWESAYGYGSSAAKANVQMDYEREFRKSADEKNQYDESMRNRMTPVMVEVEDNMAPNRAENNNYNKNTNNFFYSSNKRDYYTKEAKESKPLLSLE